MLAELVGRSLTHRIDVGRHVESPSYSSADYYPFLLAAVKLGIALLLARLVWRVARARASELAARRVLSALGDRPARGAPRVPIGLSPRLWLASFALTSAIYLVQADAEQPASVGRAAAFAPWLHSSALPVFAVLAVLLAVAWRAVQGWLAAYERYAKEAVERARRLTSRAGDLQTSPAAAAVAPPRRLHGLVFECRPPPACV